MTFVREVIHYTAQVSGRKPDKASLTSDLTVLSEVVRYFFPEQKGRVDLKTRSLISLVHSAKYMLKGRRFREDVPHISTETASHPESFTLQITPSSPDIGLSIMAIVQLVDKPVGQIGFGLMGMTWRNPPPPVEHSLEAMQAALNQGANFWNAGELYGTKDFNSCHLIKQYLTVHPEDASKIVLSIKGGLAPGEMRPDGSEKNVRRSVDECLRVLDGKIQIDIFQCARIDPRTPIETTVEALAACVKEGKIRGIGLSEVKAETIRRAAKVHPIAAVEVELSLWATDILRNGVAATCAELGIPIVAYSPLCRGVLTENPIRKNSDIPDDDHKKHLPKFQDDVLEHNNKITDEIDLLAKRKKCTKAQIAIAWVRGLTGRMVPVGPGGDRIKLGEIIPIPGATKSERVVENTTYVELTDDEMNEIADILRKNPIKGARYGENMKHVTEG